MNDLTWSPDSSYLITASSDQTCRLYAPLQHSDLIAVYDNNCCGRGSGSGSGSGSSVRTLSTHDSNRKRDSGNLTHSPWREISRPQIHGYDLHSIAASPSPNSYLLYSGADEKVLRVFDAPLCVIDGLHTLSNVNRTQLLNSDPEDITVSRVTRAYIPELGLSNRASETMSTQEKLDQDLRNVQTLNWTYAPLEGQLADYTVWPGEDFISRIALYAFSHPFPQDVFFSSLNLISSLLIYSLFFSFLSFFLFTSLPFSSQPHFALLSYLLLPSLSPSLLPALLRSLQHSL